MTRRASPVEGGALSGGKSWWRMLRWKGRSADESSECLRALTGLTLPAEAGSSRALPLPLSGLLCLGGIRVDPLGGQGAK